MSASGTDGTGREATPTQRALPRDVRLRLGHAAVQVVADEAGADVLHLKGHSVDSDLYAAGRMSSDVDVMVRPGHEHRLIEHLERHGWQTETTFASGSVFHHAMTMRNERFGHVDLHRLFPGLTTPPAEVFEAVFAQSGRREICAIGCQIPSRRDQASFILLHSARDGSRGPRDARHLRSVLSAEEWQAAVERAESWGAGGALAAALGELESWRDRPDYEFWRYMSQGGTRWDLFTARWKARPTMQERARLVGSSLIPNMDHLAMGLGRRPTVMDVARELARRVRDTVRGVARNVARRGRDGR